MFFENIPIIVQKALIYGAKFILPQTTPPLQVVEDLQMKKNTKLTIAEQNELLDELNDDNNYNNNNKKQPKINKKHLERNMNQWLEENNLILQNADKGLCTTLIDTDIYNKHLNNLLNDKNNYTQINKEEAIALVKNNYQALYNIYNNFYRAKEFKQCTKKQKTFGFPNIYLIPKVHKPKLAFRPIVNQKDFIFTQIYKNIHQYYHNKLNKHKDKDKYLICGNMDLLQKIDATNQHIKKSNLNLGDYDIASLDVTNLYGTINLDDIESTIKKTTNFNEKNDYFFYLITKTILHNNIIESNNNLYLQQNGLAMGINYAPSLANYYLFFEFDLKFKNLIASKERPWAPIQLYMRFLDDIFLLYHKKWKMNQYTNNTLNKFNNNIQFTTENSNNKSINFLDLTLTINNDTNQIDYTNYTKELKVNMMLHQEADFKQKEGLIKSQYIRLLKNNNNNNTYEKDCEQLEDDLQRRGYKQDFIKKNKINWDDRNIYFNNERKQQKRQEFSELLKKRKLCIINHHDKQHIVKKHIRKKHNDPLFVTKNYNNLYNIFFKNHKNTKYGWYDTVNTRHTTKPSHTTTTTPRTKQQPQKNNTLLNYFQKNNKDVEK